MQEKYIPQEILLIKNGELALKGLNRRTFEDALMSNLRYRLRHAGDFTLRKAQSTIFIEPKNDYVDMEEACDAVSRVFGIAAFSRARMTVKDIDAIKQAAVEYLGDRLATAKPLRWTPSVRTNPSPTPLPRLAVRWAVTCSATTIT